MTPAPHVPLVVEPPPAPGGLLSSLVPWVVDSLVRGLRALDPVWPAPAAAEGPGRAARRTDLDSRLLDHLAG